MSAPTSPTRSGQRLLLLGATGAVGSQVLQLALEHPDVAHVIAPTRRALAPHPKLANSITDLTDPGAVLAGVAIDAVVCALGTTIKQAGTQAAFATVDRDWPIAWAQAALRCGARSFALNSSLGASAGGNFYLRTKYEAEQGIRALSFASYTIVRPSLIDAEREQVRPGERIGLWVAAHLGPLIPRRYRPVPAATIASTLLRAALLAEAGVTVVESEGIL